jgi:hypothetical protein
MRTPAQVATIGAALLACGGGDGATGGTRAPLVDSCRVQLAPRSAPLPAGAPAPSPPNGGRSSRLVAHVELKLATLAKELETKVGSRLAEERNRDIGVAGHLNYTVDRGSFTVAVEGDALIVRTDVRSHAEACRGSACYASCEPQGRATATVPLRLTPDYRFPPSRVAFAFTRGCEVRALGGMVKLDVTPTIRAQLAPALRKVEQDIDSKLPPLRPEAERIWSELGKSRSLPLGGCVVTNPRGIVEGPVAGTPEALRVRFGLVAHPEIRARCGDPSPLLRPLPPLTQDPALPPEDDLVLALVSPLATTASALEGTEPFDAGGARARIARASAATSGPLAQIDVGLRGEVCGDVAVQSPLAWSDDRRLRLASPALVSGERERVSGLAGDVLVRSLAGLRFAPPVPPEALKELVPTIASGMSDPGVAVSATVSDVKPFEVDLRGEDVVASVLVRGSVELKQR